MFSEACVILFTGVSVLVSEGDQDPRKPYRERPRPPCREIETPKKETEFPWREAKTPETLQRETETPLVEDQDPIPYRETEPLP